MRTVYIPPPLRSLRHSRHKIEMRVVLLLLEVGRNPLELNVTKWTLCQATNHDSTIISVITIAIIRSIVNVLVNAIVIDLSLADRCNKL
jgi:hypothetical protein